MKKIDKSKVEFLIKKRFINDEIKRLSKLNKEKFLNEEATQVDTARMELLLQQISSKLDKLSALEDLDVSIDTLTAAMTGVDASVVQMGQATLGRFSATPQETKMMKRSKSKNPSAEELDEVMGPGVHVGGGLGVGHPSTANAVELGGGRGAPVLGWSEIAEIKDQVTRRVMEVLKDYVTTTGDAYELLVVMTQELEDKMAHQGYADNASELERFMPLQERKRASKRSSSTRKGKRRRKI